MMKKTFKYRLYPNQQERELIDKTLETCRILHNDILAEKKEAWEKEQRRITCFEQINSLPSRKKKKFFLSEVYAQTLQEVVQRVHKNFQVFFQRSKKNTKKAGYPRFKPFGRYNSFTYPQHGFEIIQGQLRLSKIGFVNIKLHRKLEGEVKTCSIIVKNGKYYACFSCEVEPKLLPKTGKKVGIDLGLTSFLATSEGKFYQAPKNYQKAEKQLAKAGRKVSRRTKGSKRRRKAVRILAVKHEKIANQRKDLAHKLSRELVRKYDLIAHEKLQVKNMAKNRYLAKSITDAGWNLFLTILTYKAEEAGKKAVEVEARNTSQICSNCSELREPKLKLSQKKFGCLHCDYQENRDINAARNILKRAELRINGSDFDKSRQGLGTSLQGAVSLKAV